MCMALCSFLILLMPGRDKALLRSVMVGGVWNGFLLGRVRGAPDGDGHFLRNAPFLLLLRFVKILSFTIS